MNDFTGMFSKAGKSAMERFSILQSTEQILNPASKPKFHSKRFTSV